MTQQHQPKWTSVLIVIFLLVNLGMLRAMYHWMANPDEALSLFQAVILLETCAALIWYTIETRINGKSSLHQCGLFAEQVKISHQNLTLAISAHKLHFEFRHLSYHANQGRITLRTWNNGAPLSAVHMQADEHKCTCHLDKEDNAIMRHYVFEIHSVPLNDTVIPIAISYRDNNGITHTWREIVELKPGPPTTVNVSQIPTDTGLDVHDIDQPG